MSGAPTPGEPFDDKHRAGPRESAGLPPGEPKSSPTDFTKMHPLRTGPARAIRDHRGRIVGALTSVSDARREPRTESRQDAFDRRSRTGRDGFGAVCDAVATAARTNDDGPERTTSRSVDGTKKGRTFARVKIIINNITIIIITV